MFKQYSITTICIVFTILCCSEVSIVTGQCLLNEYSDLPLDTDFGPSFCSENEYYKESIDGCAPGCLTKIGLGKGCHSIQDVGLCPPGLFCNITSGSSGRCDLDDTSCYRYLYNGKTTFNKPSCTPDGKWEAKQCKGGKLSGRCFCYDETGNRIEGVEWARNADDMTCACSRKREKLNADPNNWFVSLHCDDTGNFEPLQCDMLSKLCWCVEPKTGDVVSKIVPQKMWKLLSCYNETVNGEQYLRQCDSVIYAQAMSRYMLNLHGTIHVDYPHLMCDPDGSYGRKLYTTGRVICKWKDNSAAGGYQGDVTQSFDMVNCYCARDSIYYQLAGIPHTMICEVYGNYKLTQQEPNGNFYCVDYDGFKTSDIFDPENPLDCKEYLP